MVGGRRWFTITSLQLVLKPFGNGCTRAFFFLIQNRCERKNFSLRIYGYSKKELEMLCTILSCFLLASPKNEYTHRFLYFSLLKMDAVLCWLQSYSHRICNRKDWTMDILWSHTRICSSIVSTSSSEERTRRSYSLFFLRHFYRS